MCKVERTGAHSHISGLGASIGSLEDDNMPSCGMFGQIAARKAATVIVEMVRNNTVAGRAVMFAGSSGTGKTAIAHGLAKTLGPMIPFASISASEVFSVQMNKTESLTQAVRKAVRLRFREQKEILEGEIVKFEVSKKKNSIEGTVTMKTLDMESRFNLGEKMTQLLLKEKVAPGDVVCIEKDGSSFERIGKSFVRATDFDAIDSKTRLVHCPEGELSKIKDVTHVLTLHDIDVGNSRTHGFLALYNGDTGEISTEKRNAVNDKIQGWIMDGKAELVPGVLFIDEVHLLDLECFSFLNREMEKDNAPLFVFATKRGISQIRGCEYFSPHGVPQDLLDRMMIIPTNEYNKEELMKIIEIRIVEEGCEVSEAGMEILTNIAYYKSLRYALNLLSIADVIAERRQASMIAGEDLKRAYDLFVDDIRSADYMDKMADEFTKEYFDEEEDSELISLDILPIIPSWGSSTSECSGLMNILAGPEFEQEDSDNMDVDTIQFASDAKVDVQSTVGGGSDISSVAERADDRERSNNEESSSFMEGTDGSECSVSEEETGDDESSSDTEKTDYSESYEEDEASGDDESSSDTGETDDSESSEEDEESGDDESFSDTRETDDSESSADEDESSDDESSNDMEESNGSESSEDEEESEGEKSSRETEESDDSDDKEESIDNAGSNVDEKSRDEDGDSDEYNSSDESGNDIDGGSEDNGINVSAKLGDNESPNVDETVANTSKASGSSSVHPT